MRIGIIGAGGIGQAFAGHMARAGFEVILSNNHGPESLADTAKKLGGATRAGTRDEAAQADVVQLAVPWHDPHQAGGRRVLFLSGDDAGAKKDVRGLLEKAGFATINLGGLVEGGKLQQFGGPLASHNLIKLG